MFNENRPASTFFISSWLRRHRPEVPLVYLLYSEKPGKELLACGMVHGWQVGQDGEISNFARARVAAAVNDGLER